ncbi:MAG: hypothetical protein WDZ77_00330 [Candidatus Pacearchaeota archaeon]
MQNKKGQEEMVGFALIIIVVSVIILAFLGLSLSDGEKESVESYEVESFIQSFLQYSSSCEINSKVLEIDDLVKECSRGINCDSGENACEILEETIGEISEASWRVENGSSIRGYELLINSASENLVNITKGIQTGNSKGAIQFLPDGIEITFKSYY